MTIINNQRLWLGIGIEIILLISFSMIMYFILTSGNLKQNPFSSRRNGSSIPRNDQRRFIQTFLAKYGRLWRPMNITIILNNEIP